MSDIMLNAVIQMPYEMAMKDELSRRQFYERANQALNERNAKAAEIERLREALTNAEDRMRRVSRLLSEGHQFIDRGDTVRIWADDARAALSGEPT
ncbi:hypothetical protein [Alcaligenes faecalis]|uniref:hypothetical protein n=1 Tax=Alcaligenes faecalis TaxID=511 RepID=UPI001C82FD04|nr:hypothetical protein [Alcaligenes faecalis]MBX6966030.1 hypothetical protein [Providencia rettgeri]MBX7031167.1 hypothetical protein [Alcaligenes faecalis]